MTMESTSRSAAGPPPGCSACHHDVAALLSTRDLQVRYRPVADFAGCGVWGHLASVQGSPYSLLYSPRKLACAARSLGLTAELARLFFRAALSGYRDAGPSAVLVLSLIGWELQTRDGPLPAILIEELAQCGLTDRRVAILHPGGGDLTPADVRTQVESLKAAAQQGILVASNSLGCERAELLFWSQVPPQLIVTDPDILAGCSYIALGESRFGALLAAELQRGRRVVVDGIGSIGELRALHLMGVAQGAGDFIGRPNAGPSQVISAAASKVILENCACGQEVEPPVRHFLERLHTSTPWVTPKTTADEVFAMFETNRELRAVAVVKDGRPMGVISRYAMVENLARPYRHELYGRKPCTRFMDPDPVVVDVRLSLPELSAVIVEAHPRHMVSGFVVTDHGRYLGMGSIQDLMREVTQMQLDAARYANPLTGLPGNVPINQHIDDLLQRREWCVFGYCDLDDFKPFNDVYGYAKGDDVLRLTARILGEICDADGDFLGHIGGDDFLVIFRSPDWEERCQRALANFEASITNFFARDDVEQGGYVPDNRKGQREFHAITALSIGIVEAIPGMFANHLSIAKVAAEVKKKAKAIAGNSFKSIAAPTPENPTCVPQMSPAVRPSRYAPPDSGRARRQRSAAFPGTAESGSRDSSRRPRRRRRSIVLGWRPEHPPELRTCRTIGVARQTVGIDGFKHVGIRRSGRNRRSRQNGTAQPPGPPRGRPFRIRGLRRGGARRPAAKTTGRCLRHLPSRRVRPRSPRGP